MRKCVCVCVCVRIYIQEPAAHVLKFGKTFRTTAAKVGQAYYFHCSFAARKIWLSMFPVCNLFLYPSFSCRQSGSDEFIQPTHLYGGDIAVCLRGFLGPSEVLESSEMAGRCAVCCDGKPRHVTACCMKMYYNRIWCMYIVKERLEKVIAIRPGREAWMLSQAPGINTNTNGFL